MTRKIERSEPGASVTWYLEGRMSDLSAPKSEEDFRRADLVSSALARATLEDARKNRDRVADVLDVSRFNRRVRMLLLEYGPWCWLCGLRVLLEAPTNHPLSPSTDHFIERRNGGTHDFENLRLAHIQCNAARRNRFSQTNQDGILRSGG